MCSAQSTLGEMARFHREQNALATLAVQQRKSSRYLLFDAQPFDAQPNQLQLCGRRTVGKADEVVRAAVQAQPWGFAGIHVISPRIFGSLGQGSLRRMGGTAARHSQLFRSICAWRLRERKSWVSRRRDRTGAISGHRQIWNRPLRTWNRRFFEQDGSHGGRPRISRRNAKRVD